MTGPLTAVVLHWNQPDSCLETVDRFLADPTVADVILVDNGSEPGHFATLRTGLDHRSEQPVELIEVGHNSGFGPGVNRGWERWLAERATPWCAVAPHDALPASGTLAALIAAGEQHELGMVSADVGDGRMQVVDHVFGPIDHPAPRTDGLELVDYPHGTLMIVSRACLVAVGLFDERYFAYCEEADLGLRAKVAGFPTGLLYGARVENPHVNTPAPMIDYLKERNTVLLVASHFGWRKGVMRLGLTAWHLLRGAFQPTSRVAGWSGPARVTAIRDVLRRRWGPPPAHVTVRPR